MRKIKVVYITGWGRSGSTLLANILGQIPGWFAAGELRAIWEFSLQEKARCGCKSEFRNCETWKKIFNTAFKGFDKVDILELQNITRNKTRSLQLPWFFLNKGKHREFPQRKKYLATLEKLYIGIAEATNCNVLIDSSKAPVYAGILRLIPSIDLYIIHMIRDPRAVAFSWLAQKENTVYKESLESRNPLDNALNWNAGNLAAEYLGLLENDKYIRIKYDDFVTAPQKYLSKILKMLDEPEHNLPFETDRTIRINPTHTVWGNPNRFKTGIIKLRADIRWESNLNKRDRFLTTLLTFPLMIAYGYKL